MAEDKRPLREEIEDAIHLWASGIPKRHKKSLADSIEELINDHLKERLDAVDLERQTAVNKLGWMTMAMYTIAEYQGTADENAVVGLRNIADRAVQIYGYEEFVQQQIRIQEAAKEARARLTDKDGWTCMVPPCVIALIEAVLGKEEE